MALGFFVREVAKAVAIGAGAELLRERVIPPLSKKVKKKLGDLRSKSESENKETEHTTREYEAKWE